MLIMLVIGSVPVLLSILFFKEIRAVCFDRGFAESVGIAPRFVDAMLDLMTVCCTIMGLQTVGVILMSALLIAPAVAARQWTDRLSVMTLISCGIGVFSGVAGAFISTLSPKMPTGPVIVVIVSLIVILSLLFAPRRGILSKIMVRRAIKRSVQKKEVKA